MRAAILALILALLAGSAMAVEVTGPGWRLDTGNRLRLAGTVNGWTVLRDRAAPPRADDYGLILVRVQRPVPVEDRGWYLDAVLRNLRPFRFRTLPAPEMARHGGLPNAVLEATGFSAQTGLPQVVRAEAIYAPDRTFLLIAAAPETQWPGLRDALLTAMASFRPERRAEP
ncbi:MAG: hypothetical protein IRY87_03930 [Acetobacteraceae bacterium]|nr:hypothetical protein [Acetobacteraceae bacterium]